MESYSWNKFEVVGRHDETKGILTSDFLGVFREEWNLVCPWEHVC